jgi:hypothetical protein
MLAASTSSIVLPLSHSEADSATVLPPDFIDHKEKGISDQSKGEIDENGEFHCPSTRRGTIESQIHEFAICKLISINGPAARPCTAPGRTGARTNSNGWQIDSGALQPFRSNSGSLAMLAAMRRASKRGTSDGQFKSRDIRTDI